MGEKRTTKEIVRLVLDTNIWVSLILDKRLTKSFRPIIDVEKQFPIYMSNQMLTELAKVLTYPRIARILENSGVDSRSALSSVTRRVILQTVTEGTVDAVKSDPSDNRILECAIDSKVSYIVSGDPHLLDLKEFKGIRIVSASQIVGPSRSLL
jgi:putative PIN family toxin of toxin-antitoxin system